MATYHFDDEVCKECGFPAAVLMYNIEHWVRKNKANNKHFYDGRYWTYNSMSAFAELYSFLTDRQVRTGLQNLENAGYIVTGNYNKDARDRTKWYALGDRLHLTSMSNGDDSHVKCINEADNKHTDNKHNPPIVPQGDVCRAERFEEFWSAYPRKTNKKAALTKWKSMKLDRIADEIIAKTKERVSRDVQWRKDGGQYIPHASTYLNGERWNDEYSTETRHENTSRNTRKQTAADILERERQIIRERAEQERYAQDPTVINGEFFIC